MSVVKPSDHPVIPAKAGIQGHEALWRLLWTAAFKRVRKSPIGWINVVRSSRQPLRGFLRMRTLLNAINRSPHAEERPKGASRSTHGLAAALLTRSANFPTASFAGMTITLRGVTIRSGGL
jgi:hypothetical protein